MHAFSAANSVAVRLLPGWLAHVGLDLEKSRIRMTWKEHQMETTNTTVSVIHDSAGRGDDTPTGDRVESALELGAFLRRRRESLDPRALGMPRYGRVRTPGLRREEVAQLADIGITWYTKLEQGRPIRVSPRVLEAVASALQCSESETRYLFTLAGLARPGEHMSGKVCRLMPAAVQQILDQLHPLPAVLLNAHFDIQAFNEAFCRLSNLDLNMIPIEERNYIKLVLTNPDIGKVVQDRDQMIRHMAAKFRADMASHLSDPVWERKLHGLLACSGEFREVWQQNLVCATVDHVVKYQYEGSATLEVLKTNWWSTPQLGDRLIVYVPVGEHDWQLLREYIARPRGLSS